MRRSGGRPALNVLLLLVDDLRPALRCYGDRQAVTPNMDALAAESALFTRAYAQQALCGPSRTSLLTSRRPEAVRQLDVHSYWREAAGNFTSLPQMLRQRGLHTAALGKVFHPGIVSNFSDDQPYSWSEPPYHPPTEQYKNSRVCLGPDGQLRANLFCPVDPATQPGRSLPDIQIAETAARWLRQRARSRTNQPWMLAVGLHKPHIPLKFPAQYLSLHPYASVALPRWRRRPAALPAVSWNPWCDVRRRDDVTPLNVSFPYGSMPDWFSRALRQGYAAAVSYVDDLIGQVLQTLRRSGQAERTVVVVAGDHGWALGERGEWAKYSTSEDATRTPLLIHIPGVTGSLKTFQHHQPLKTKSGRQQARRHVGMRRQTQGNGMNKGGFSAKGGNMTGFPVMKPRHTRVEELAMNNATRLVRARRINTIQHYFSERNPPPTEVTDSGTNQIQQPTEVGCRIETPVELLDIMPTLADTVLGLEMPTCPKFGSQPDLCTQGKSLVPLITKCTSEHRRARAIHNRRPDRTETHQQRASHSPNKTGARMQPCDHPLPFPLSAVPAAFSQYPRPSVRPQLNSDQPRLSDIRLMGYSVRTERYRYTAWVGFDPARFAADWGYLSDEELYDHAVDAEEAENLAQDGRCRRLKRQLKTMVKAQGRLDVGES